MAGIINMPFWAKNDDKDKYDGEPGGAFYLSGHIEVGPADIVLKAGTKIGLAVRRNRNWKERAPNYYGELFAFSDEARAPGGSTP